MILFLLIAAGGFLAFGCFEQPWMLIIGCVAMLGACICFENLKARITSIEDKLRKNDIK